MDVFEDKMNNNFSISNGGGEKHGLLQNGEKKSEESDESNKKNGNNNTNLKNTL